jgi:uncharacterized membrane protein YcaP (DUF421 family)
MSDAVLWWEVIARAAFVYLLVILLLRLSGKRQVGQLTPFDLTLLLLISEAGSNALTAGDNSVFAAAVAIATLLALNAGIGKLASRSQRVEDAVEGRPRILVRDGRVDYATLRREAITPRELLVALRGNGCFTPHQAEYAVLEPSGRISVRKRGDKPA